MHVADLSVYEETSRLVRAGRRHDLDQIVAIHKLSFPDTFGSRLGKSYLRAFYAWFLTEPAALCLVAAEERLLGYVVGCQDAHLYYNEFYGKRRKALLYAALRGLIENPLALFHVRRAFPVILPFFTRILRRPLDSPQRGAETMCDSEPQHASLNVIAVHPSVLGTQVGTVLLSAFVRAAQERGATRIQLSVNKKNKRAIRFYEREGWQLVAETSLNFIYAVQIDA